MTKSLVVERLQSQAIALGISIVAQNRYQLWNAIQAAQAQNNEGQAEHVLQLYNGIQAVTAIQQTIMQQSIIQQSTPSIRNYQQCLIGVIVASLVAATPIIYDCAKDRIAKLINNTAKQ